MQTRRVVRSLIAVLAVFCAYEVSAQSRWLLQQEFVGQAQRIYDLECADSLNCVAAGSKRSVRDADVYRTTDGGVTWVEINAWERTDESELIFYAVTNPVPEIAMIAERSGRLIRTTDAGGTWNMIALDTIGNLIAVRVASTGFGGAFKHNYWPVVYVTTDTGATWQPHRLPGQYNGSWWWDFAISGDNALRLLGGNLEDTSRFMLTSRDSARTWDSLPLPLHIDHVIFVSESAGWGVGFKLLEGKNYVNALVMRTTDGGLSWQTRMDTLLGGFGIDDAVFLNEQEGWIAGAIERVFHTTDGGATWTFEPLIAPFIPPQFLWIAMPPGSPGVVVSSFAQFYLRSTQPSAAPVQRAGGAGISVYPNPVAYGADLVISMPESVSVYPQRVSLVDVLGRAVVCDFALSQTNGRRELHLRVPEGISAGGYYVRVTQGRREINGGVVLIE